MPRRRQKRVVLEEEEEEEIEMVSLNGGGGGGGFEEDGYTYYTRRGIAIRVRSWSLPASMDDERQMSEREVWEMRRSERRFASRGRRANDTLRRARRELRWEEEEEEEERRTRRRNCFGQLCCCEGNVLQQCSSGSCTECICCFRHHALDVLTHLALIMFVLAVLCIFGRFINEAITHKSHFHLPEVDERESRS